MIWLYGEMTGSFWRKPLSRVDPVTTEEVTCKRQQHFYSFVTNACLRVLRDWVPQISFDGGSKT